MADGSSSMRGAAGSLRDKVGDVPILSPRVSPALVAANVLLLVTRSGSEVVTSTPALLAGSPPDVKTDVAADSSTPTVTSTPSTSQLRNHSQSSQLSTLSSTSSSAPVEHNRLTNGKLAAVIVVPLILMALGSPILIVWFLSWRRRRRREQWRRNRRSHLEPPPTEHHKNRRSSFRYKSSNKASRRARGGPRPSPTYSSFNFGLSRVGSLRTMKSGQRQFPSGLQSRHSLVCPWDTEAPPPYTSTQVPTQPGIATTPVVTRFSSTAPRLDTPSFPDFPLLETAQMVHIRPISSPPATRSTSAIRNRQRSQQGRSNMLQPPDVYGDVRTRQSSIESDFSVHNRATLRQPFSPLHSPAFSDVSGLSFDPTLWASVMYGRDSIVSPLDAEDQNMHSGQIRPHQMV